MGQEHGVHSYINWIAVKYMLLKPIKEHCTILGTTTTIFARDEYQGNAGNLSHNHLIFAVDKTTMSGNTEMYIHDLIRTSVARPEVNWRLYRAYRIVSWRKVLRRMQ